MLAGQLRRMGNLIHVTIQPASQGAGAKMLTDATHWGSQRPPHDAGVECLLQLFKEGVAPIACVSYHEVYRTVHAKQ